MTYNLIGRRFGMLLVVGEAPYTKTGKRRWLCECDCGNKSRVLTNDLTSGHSTSCGCARQKGSIVEALREIDRLQEAKRAALKVADERSKENCALRQENERLLALTTRLRTAAERVCWFDWSNNDRDAVEAITELRLALEQKARPEDFASDNGFC